MKQKVVPGGTIDTVTEGEIAKLLREFAAAGHVAFGGDSIEKRLDDWPVKGHSRIIRVGRTSGDSNLALVANAYTDVLPQDAGRGGLSLINIGANPAFVFLATAQEAKDRSGKLATGYLFAGGSWDGKISDQLWVGPISVQSVLGTTLVLGTI